MFRLMIFVVAALLTALSTVAQEASEAPEAASQESIVVTTPESTPADSLPAPSVDDVIAGEATVYGPGLAVHDHGAAVCHPIEVVDTRTRLSARRVFREAGDEKSVTVCVENPACLGKLNTLSLCIPCCINGPAQVCNPRCGLLLGRGKVDLVWDCGFTAKVTFLACGDAVVTYSAS